MDFHKNNKKHPEHKYSKYIDNDFSYSNRVYSKKIDLVDGLMNMRCDGSIMLEPRLQEYIKKKKFNKDNGIVDCVSLEKEYQITNSDLDIIRAFMKGRRDIYTNDKFNIYKKEKKRKKQYFPSKEYRDDDRIPKLEKTEHKKPNNMGMFVPDSGEFYYDVIDPNKSEIMDSRDFASRNTKGIKGFSLDDTRFDPRTDMRMDPGIETHDKYSSQYKVKSDKSLDSPTSLDQFFGHSITNVKDKRLRKHHHKKQDNKKKNGKIEIDKDEFLLDGPLSNNLNQFKPLESCSNSSNPFDYSGYGSFDKTHDSFRSPKTYGKYDEPSFSEKSDMDSDNKMVIPNISSNAKRDLSTFDYRMGPNSYDDINEPLKDADFETTLIRGMPHNTKKSYGYRQPFENQFQYIDDDFQNAENSDLPWVRGGDSTRRDNKKIARQEYNNLNRSLGHRQLNMM